MDWSRTDYVWFIVMIYQLFGLILKALIHYRWSTDKQLMQC